MISIDEMRTQIAGVSDTGGGVISYLYQADCTFTDEQKAAIEASQIQSKWATAIPAMLEAKGL